MLWRSLASSFATCTNQLGITYLAAQRIRKCMLYFCVCELETCIQRQDRLSLSISTFAA